MGNEVVDTGFDASQMPDDLAAAANMVRRLAEGGLTEDWRNCSEVEHLEAQEKAIDFMRARLEELDKIRRESAQERLRHCENQMKALLGILRLAPATTP